MCFSTQFCAFVTLWFCIASDKQKASLLDSMPFLSGCACVFYGERGEERVRYSQSQWVDGASCGSCVLGVHYCNEGSMAATLAGPQAAQYSRSNAVWITLIKAFLHPSTTILSKSSEITVTYLRRPDPKSMLLSPTVLHCQTVAERRLRTK